MIYAEGGPAFLTDARTTACFTGHRPEKFPFDTSVKLFRDMIASVIYLHICDAAAEGYLTFISGMQRGTDIWAAQEVIKAKKAYPEIKLVCVCPFEGEELKRPPNDRREYEEIAALCDSFVILQREFTRDCYTKRNRFMVDNSSLVIAAAADRHSGTWQTVNYARKCGVRVDVIDLDRFAEDYGLDRY